MFKPRLRRQISVAHYTGLEMFLGYEWVCEGLGAVGTSFYRPEEAYSRWRETRRHNKRMQLMRIRTDKLKRENRQHRIEAAKKRKQAIDMQQCTVEKVFVGACQDKPSIWQRLFG